jgi:hypothetical protein
VFSAVRGLDESYIPKTVQAPADAGAGLHPEATTHFPQYPSPRSPRREVVTSSGMAPDTSPLTAGSIPIAPPADDPILPFASASADGSPRAPPSPATESLLLPNHPSTSGTVPLSAMSTITRPASPGLSSELRRILNLSSLDPDVRSVVLGRSALLGGGGGGHTATGSFGSNAGAADVGATSTAGSNAYSSNYVEDRRMERQYMWLERYHAHVAAQQQGQIHGASAGTSAGGGAAAGSSLDASGSTAGQPRRRQQQPPPPPPNRPAQDEEDIDGSLYRPFGSIV